MRCLRNGLAKRLSRRVTLRRTARTGGFGLATGGRGKKLPSTAHPEAVRCYTPTVREPIMEIPVKCDNANERR